jgi:type IV pilus assembly protein PilC
MPTYSYVAKDQDAQTVTGKIEAGDPSMVHDELHRRQLVIISVEEEKKKSSFSQRPQGRARRITTDDLVLFSRQMATMVDAGIPIIQTMEALEEQAINPSFRKILATVLQDIRMGLSLSDAFGKHPKVFDNLFVSMVRVGEVGGVLTNVLDRLSSYMEKTARLKRKVKGALIYPAVIVSMAFIISVILLIKVVPTFAEIYTSFNQKLPPMTQSLLDFSAGFRKFFLLYVFSAVALVFAIFQYKRTPAGAYQVDLWLLKIPLFGDLMIKAGVSRFCRTLSALVQSGVPILDGLEIVRKTIGNRVLEKVVEEVTESVRGGEGIAATLSRSRIFPIMATRMISIGEKSGQLDKMLSKVAVFYDDQVDVTVDTMTSLIEPLIIAVLGIVIGYIVTALFLPIMNITQVLK